MCQALMVTWHMIADPWMKWYIVLICFNLGRFYHELSHAAKQPLSYHISVNLNVVEVVIFTSHMSKINVTLQTQV